MPLPQNADTVRRFVAYLHTLPLPPLEWRQDEAGALETLSLTYLSETLAGRFTVFADASSAIEIIDAATERQTMWEMRENAGLAALQAHFAQFLAACGLALPSAHT